MVRPTIKKQIPNLQEAIKETAWKQIAEFGAPALSLRAIARELKITAPAIYNYFPSRDHLATALIVDAFTSLGDSQKAAQTAAKNMDSAALLADLGLAYRNWAVTYPQRYQLIFGTPIPGYNAPEDTTTPAAAWALLPLIETIQQLYNDGDLHLERFAKLSAKLKSMLEAWKKFSGNVAEAEALYTAYVVWARVHGLVMLELGGQIPSFFTDPGELFRREVATMVNQYTGE
ncbi:MAG: TetR/AcrR family transcriptional regulator [Chloroflexi bacterium]|nr:TetR/AcrR family transcriptional regulator [Chloroflexota bacterium]